VEVLGAGTQALTVAHRPGRFVVTRRAQEVPTCYEVRIGEHLDHHWSTWFDGLTLTLEDDGTTTLRGVVRDQAELHGLLDRIRDLGTTLVSVRPVGTHDDTDAAGCSWGHRARCGAVPRR
jgi:hypothetical protein